MSRASKTKLGDCYKASAEFQWHNKDLPLLLVHGTCTGKGAIEGVNFGHAWLELGDLVFNVANGKRNVVRKDVYYRVGACRNTRHYTRQEAAKMMLETGHYGPWHDDAKKDAYAENKSLTQSKGVDRVNAS